MAAKKRKASASGEPYGGQSKKKGAAAAAAAANRSSSKLNITSFEDVADSEDEFHINRDKVLLEEGPEAKRRRKLREKDEFLELSDEEVLAYSSPSEDEEDEEENGGSQGEEEEESDDDFGLKPKKDADLSEDDEDGNWGPSKKDYYNADKIETEQDALEEEAEAKRLQQKQLEAMTEADYAFDESEWLQDNREEDEQREGDDVVTEVLPQLQITEDMGTEERLKLLKTRYPEFDHLAKEFLDLQSLHRELALAATAAVDLLKRRNARTNTPSPTTKPPIAVIKYQALAAYLAAIAMYFALLTSTSQNNGNVALAKSPLELRDHPVMEGLVKCRELWNKVKNQRITEALANLDENDLGVIEEEEESEAEEISIGDIPLDSDKKRKKAGHKQKKTKAQRLAAAAQAEAVAKRAEKIRKVEEELATLSSLTDKSARQKVTKTKPEPSKPIITNPDDSDFGDDTELTAQELAEKAKRKKSLKFYTSQIAQKSNKRGTAGKDAGGDMDIPHRERLKDRQARLLAEAEKRGKKKADAREELGGESDDEDRRQARQLRGEDGADDDEYYDMVAARSKGKKAEKQALAEAYAQAAREGGELVEKEEIGPDGKRKITYAIEKNKGLAPKRKKDVRNPRVKKRMKFEEKKKKLRSIRAVYQGGEGRGGYKGELTGIKKGLVKSVKL